MATKAKGKPEPAKRDTNTLTVQAKPGDTESAAIARTLLRPSVQAAGTLKEYTKRMVDADLTGLVEELAAQAKAVNDGDLKRAEAMLTIQAHTWIRFLTTWRRRRSTPNTWISLTAICDWH